MLSFETVLKVLLPTALVLVLHSIMGLTTSGVVIVVVGSVKWVVSIILYMITPAVELLLKLLTMAVMWMVMDRQGTSEDSIMLSFETVLKVLLPTALVLVLHSILGVVMPVVDSVKWAVSTIFYMFTSTEGQFFLVLMVVCVWMLIGRQQEVGNKSVQRPTKVEEEMKKCPAGENVQEMPKKSTDESNIISTLQDEEMLKKIRPVFVSNIIPENILHVFHRYNTNVLSQRDIEKITCTTKHSGKTEGAEELLNRLVKYYDWFNCLLLVLRDSEVKLRHLADKMQEAVDCIGMRKTEDEVKEKAETLIQMTDFTSEDSITCLKCIYDATLNSKKEIGDLLSTSTPSFPGTCIKILRVVLTETNVQDSNIWPVIHDTCRICWCCSSASPGFSKRLAESGAVRFLTDTLKNSSYTDNVHKEKERYVLKTATVVLLHIADNVREIPDFKNSGTVEALISLTTSSHETIQVYAIMALVYIVKEKERDTLPTDMIKLLVSWIPKVLDNNEAQGYKGLLPGELSATLARLAVNDRNKRMILEAGALNEFATILTRPDIDCKEHLNAALCLSKMASNNEISKAIQERPGLVNALEDLNKNSKHADVRKLVLEALNVIEGRTTECFYDTLRPPKKM